MALLWSIVAIVACAVIGALAGLGVIVLADLSGLPAALVGVVVGMVAGALAWIAGVMLLGKLGILK